MQHAARDLHISQAFALVVAHNFKYFRPKFVRIHWFQRIFFQTAHKFFHARIFERRTKITRKQIPAGNPAADRIFRHLSRLQKFLQFRFAADCCLFIETFRPVRTKINEVAAQRLF